MWSYINKEKYIVSEGIYGEGQLLPAGDDLIFVFLVFDLQLG